MLLPVLGSSLASFLEVAVSAAGGVAVVMEAGFAELLLAAPLVVAFGF